MLMALNFLQVQLTIRILSLFIVKGEVSRLELMRVQGRPSVRARVYMEISQLLGIAVTVQLL